MPKNLVIVESPAKAKTIERFLGNDFKVVSSNGHIADLPSKELGINVDNNYEPKYIVSSDKKDIVKKLKKESKPAEMIWLASDEDRENQGASISYKMPNGMTIGAFTFKSEDDLDVGEEYTASGAEVQYNIASGLKATISVVDYDYKITTANHESADTSADSGTMTQLTIGASF